MERNYISWIILLETVTLEAYFYLLKKYTNSFVTEIIFCSNWHMIQKGVNSFLLNLANSVSYGCEIRCAKLIVQSMLFVLLLILLISYSFFFHLSPIYLHIRFYYWVDLPSVWCRSHNVATISPVLGQNKTFPHSEEKLHDFGEFFIYIYIIYFEDILLAIRSSDSEHEWLLNCFRCIFQNATYVTSMLLKTTQCYWKLTSTQMVATKNTFQGSRQVCLSLSVSLFLSLVCIVWTFIMQVLTFICNIM